MVLRLASPVLATLIGPRFAEGHALRRSKLESNEPAEIELQDDDAKALGTMLKIIHMCPVPKYISKEELIELARVVDKYMCQRACSGKAIIWTKEHLSLRGFSKDLIEFLGLAITFHSCEVMNITSIGLALTSAAKGKNSLRERVAKSTLGYLIPEHVIIELDEMREAYSAKIMEALSSHARLISRWDDDDDSQKLPAHSAWGYSRHGEQTIRSWNDALANAHVPDMCGIESPMRTLYRLCGIARALGPRLMERADTISLKRNLTRYNCKACRFILDIEEDLFQIVLDVMQGDDGLYSGLCLCTDFIEGFRCRSTIRTSNAALVSGISAQLLSLFRSTIFKEFVRDGFHDCFESSLYDQINRISNSALYKESEVGEDNGEETE